MKSDVETLSPTKVRLTVEVPFDELSPSLAAAYKEIARQVRIPGFRPGKVPALVIDQRVGRAAVLEQALNDALPRFYDEAVREAELAVLGQPHVDITTFADGEPFAFVAEVEVRPEITLPDLAAFDVQLEDVQLTDEMVDAQLSLLRDRFAVLEGVERAAETGDFLLLDLTGSIDGEELEDLAGQGMSYELGSGSLGIPGIDEALVGAAEGDTVTFAAPIEFGEHTGKEAQMSATVRSVKVKNMPELDDEFAQTASEFDTIDELREDTRSRLRRQRWLAIAGQARDKTVETVVAMVEIPVPEGLLANEIGARRQSVDQQLEQAGMTLSDYLQMQGKSEDEFASELEADAIAAIKGQFLLESIAAAEQLGVSEAELTDQIVRLAQRQGVSPDAYAQAIMEAGQVPHVWADVLRNKALSVLVDRARLLDETGAEVDIEALRLEAFPEPEPIAADPSADSETDSSGASD